MQSIQSSEKHNERVKPNFITYKTKISELEKRAVQTALQHRSTPERTPDHHYPHLQLHSLGQRLQERQWFWVTSAHTCFC